MDLMLKFWSHAHTVNVLMQDNSYQKFLQAYPDAFTDLKDMNVNWDDFGALKPSYSMLDDTHYGVPFDNGAVIA